MYVACAEAMNKLAVETKDDPNFQKALKENVNNILRKAETAAQLQSTGKSGCAIPFASAQAEETKNRPVQNNSYGGTGIAD